MDKDTSASASNSQALAASLFSDMVMEEAIKDKEIELKQQMKDEAGNLIEMEDVDDYLAK